MNREAAGALFLTGMQRSGTTLLEKLLHAHPRLSVLSQPFPRLFVEAKRAFLAERGRPAERYPLGPLFPAPDYRPADLAEFLARHRLTAAGTAALFARMAEDPGQYHRPDPDRLAAALPQIDGLTLPAAAARLWRALSPKPGAAWYGGKETLGEELVPALLAAGVRCLILLRDPRDVLASLNAGEGARHAGAPKPTLFNLRHWRKSVAFALAHERHPGLRWLRYEDLVAHPHEVLDGLAAWLAVAPFDDLDGELRDQQGRPWEGNSSHAPRRGVDARAIGTHRQLLPRAVRELTETVCGPEMACLGYGATPRRFGPAPADLIRGFEDPYGDARPELAAWAADPERAEEEIRRLRELQAPTDAAGYFLFPEVCERLRSARGAAG